MLTVSDCISPCFSSFPRKLGTCAVQGRHAPSTVPSATTAPLSSKEGSTMLLSLHRRCVLMRNHRKRSIAVEMFMGCLWLLFMESWSSDRPGSWLTIGFGYWPTKKWANIPTAPQVWSVRGEDPRAGPFIHSHFCCQLSLGSSVVPARCGWHLVLGCSKVNTKVSLNLFFIIA